MDVLCAVQIAAVRAVTSTEQPRKGNVGGTAENSPSSNKFGRGFFIFRQNRFYLEEADSDGLIQIQVDADVTVKNNEKDSVQEE